MGVLVDVVGLAIAPVLQELRRGPGVIDLVEVHLVRLGQAIDPEDERGDDEHGQDPDIEPVEAAARLVVKGPGSVGQRRTGVDHSSEPRRETRPGGRRRVRRAGRAIRCRAWAARATLRGGEHSSERRRRRAGRGVGARALGPRGLMVLGHRRLRKRQGRAGPGDLPGQGGPACRPELGQRPGEDHQVDHGDDGDALRRADRRSDAEPVADARVARVEGRQDDVQVEEADRTDDEIGDAPSERERRQDRPDRHEREQVAFVDPGRDHEEGDGDDGEADEDGPPVGMSSDDPADDTGSTPRIRALPTTRPTPGR